ncbi:MAG: methionyl-tRNA formyltransferase [Desulfobacteraceae bacterium]|nr:MAG: methionyl-tRNA formyltransferase [Desulfobacteraceae bacterium]
MPINIGYFADGRWAQNALELFIHDPGISVQFLVPRYRHGDELLIKMATRVGIPVISCPNINAPDFLKTLGRYGCDLFVSMSFDQIFRREIINLPPLKTINCHAGKLPFYRGRNVLNWVLINDETEFGITVHFVDEGIDTGDILVQKSYPISDSDNYATLLRQAEIECARLLYEAVKRISSGKWEAKPQSSIHPFGFYCVKRGEGDEILDWNATSRNIFNFIRAVCPPGPSARTFLEGTELRINRALYIPDAPRFKGVPGSVIGRDEESFCVKTRDTHVRVVSWEFEGKIRIGDRLKPYA